MSRPGRLITTGFSLFVAGCIGEPPAVTGQDDAVFALADAWRRGDCVAVLALATSFTAATDRQLSEATVWLGTCLRRGDRFADAVIALAPVARAAPPVARTPRALLETGRAQYGAGDFTAGAATLASITARFSQHPLVDEGLYYQGKALRRAGQPESALQILATAESHPDSSEFRRAGARYEHGKANRMQARFSDAQADFETVRDRYGASAFAPLASLAIARLALDKGDCDRAEADLAAFAIAAPTPATAAAAAFHGARAVERCGDPLRAEALYLEIEADFPSATVADDARYRWAKVAFDQARAADRQDDPTDQSLYGAARGRLAGFLADHPASSRVPAAQLHLGRAWLETRGHGQALAELASVTALPTSVWFDNALYYTGLTHYLRRAGGDLTAAVAVFERVIELPGPSSYADNAAYYRGRALLDDGQSAAALIAFAELVADHSASGYRDNALFYLALTAVQTSDCAKAIAARDQLRAEYPTSAYVAQADAVTLGCGTP